MLINLDEKLMKDKLVSLAHDQIERKDININGKKKSRTTKDGKYSI